LESEDFIVDKTYSSKATVVVCKKYAKDAGVLPKEYVDSKVTLFERLCKQFNISNDNFIRTTDEYHEELARLLFSKVLDKGEIYLGKRSCQQPVK